MPANALREKIENRSAVICVVGLGYVGLPLVVEFVRAGFKVVGYDVSQRVVDLLNRGESHIQDVAAGTVKEMVDRGSFTATSDASVMADSDVVSIAVPTPLSKTRDPDMSFVIAVRDSLVEFLHPALLIVLESTTYPGTTRELLLPAIEERGLVVGEDVFLAFSPERVDPGNTVWNTRNTPKVVGGITPACTTLATALYSTSIETVVPVSTPETAELVKLLENTFRSVNIGLVNEMAIVCDKLGVDVWEVIEAAATKPFGFMKFTPGPGIGGHCIPLDPHYLAWKMRTLNYKTRFVDLASEINSAMPAFVVDKTMHALNDEKKSVNGSRVLVVGVAYKKDIDDVRESPAVDIVRLLESYGATVGYHDPYVSEFDDDRHVLKGIDLTAAALSEVDAVVIVTDHTVVDYQFIVDNSRLVVDTRNVTRGCRPGRARVVSLSSITPRGVAGAPTPRIGVPA
jgi:UDP-N-acetyl-D-glucosamine dehydrogenase